MKTSLVFIMLASICVETSYSQNGSVDNDTIISWSKNRMLKWEDFKGIKDSVNFTENVAVTDYSISLLPRNIKVNEYDKINAVALFFKKTSWTVTESLGLLKHEQIHFDIAELYARKIRKCFSEMKKDNVSDIYSYIEIAKKLGNQCTVLQDLYDSETAHGTIGIKQLEWEEKIAKKLNNLDIYTSDVKIENIED